MLKRPLVIGLLFMIAGIIYGRGGFSYIAAALFSVLLLIAAVGIMRSDKIVSNFYYIFIFLMLAGLGYLRVNQSLSDRVPIFSGIDSQTVSFTGIVSSIPKTGAFYLDVKRVTDDGRVTKMGMRLYVTLKDAEPELRQEVTVTGTLMTLKPSRNPGGFDELLYYRTRKVDLRLYGESIIYGGIKKDLYYYLEIVKNGFAKVYDNALGDMSGTMKSIMLGDKADLGEDTRELYTRAGIYHILAISGLHISLIFLLVLNLLRRFLKEKTASIIGIIVAVLYCLMIGAPASCVRAVIMCGMTAAAPLLGRKKDQLTSIAMACLCLIVYEPLYIYDIGFQFSFVAVAGLCLFTEPISRMFERFIPFYWLRTSLSAVIAAQAATTPILGYHFYYINPYSVLVNLFVVPTTEFMTVMGLVLGLVGFLSGGGAVFLAGSLRFLLYLYHFVCELSLALPFAEILTGCWPLLVVLLFYLLLFAVCGYFAFLKIRNITAAFVIGSAFYITLIAYRYYPYGMTVIFLDVGQGDCSVVTLNGACYVIDGGGYFGRDIGKNTGKMVLVPYLNYRGISYVDAVFVSHEHSDHVVGVIELLSMKRVGTLFLPGAAFTENSMDPLIQAAALDNNVPVAYLSRGDVLSSGEITMDCLNPVKDQKHSDLNDTSLVMLLQYGNTKFLFTGDSGSSFEREAVKWDIDLTCDIYKAGHHGSKYSNSAEYLEMLNPKVCVISRGLFNIYNHPSPVTLERLNDLEIPYFDTGLDGAVIVHAKNNVMKVKSMIQ